MKRKTVKKRNVRKKRKEVNKENETEIEGKKSNDSDVELITIDNETLKERDSENIDISNGNETETKTKRVITMKEYERRRENVQTINIDKASVQKPLPLDNIMDEMIKTYTMPSCLTPIRETTPEPQSPPLPSLITDDEETLRAVVSISVVENETFVYCSNGTDMADDVLSELREEIISDEIIEAVVTESVKKQCRKGNSQKRGNETKKS